MSQSTESTPTARQLRYLRSLAERSGTTFAYPATREEASRQIKRLRKLDREPRRRPSAGEVAEEQAEYATAIDPSEVSGYGASATWRLRQPSGQTNAHA